MRGVVALLKSAEMFYAAAEAARGLVTSCESDAKEGEMLAKASGLLAARLPPLETTLCAVSLAETPVSLSRTERIPRVGFLN